MDILHFSLLLLLLLVLASLQLVDALNFLQLLLADLGELLQEFWSVHSFVEDEVESIFRACFYSDASFFHREPIARREQRVDTDSESVVQHGREQLG